MRTVSLQALRRLAVERQNLGPTTERRVNEERILDLFRDIGCVQIDPISVVAPTQEIVLWSRLGSFDKAVFEKVMWEDRSVFTYWAHAASLVMTEDYPIHALGMKSWRSQDAVWTRRIRDWMEQNKSLRRSILAQIRAKGPVRARDLGAGKAVPWTSTGWTNEQGVIRMLEFLWFEGKIVIAGRTGGSRLWDLMDRFLPGWTPRGKLPQKKIVELAAVRAIRAQGISTPAHIRYHFTRGRYPDLPAALRSLVDRGEIERVQVEGEAGVLKGEWYVHAADLPRVERLEADGDRWAGRTTLLSPFDNLICDRKRTLLLWDFDYKIEIYTPKAKRRYGYYVLPILWHDRLIGRIDAAVDKKAGALEVKAIFEEPGAPAEAGQGIADALGSLAYLVGANEVRFPRAVPRMWKPALRG